jgi:transposase
MYIKKSKVTRRTDSDGIIKALHLSVGHTTVTKAIHELGYRRCVARRRPLLKPLDLKRRLAFAKAHKHWTVEDWKRVIWTDEMSIKIGDERKDIMWVWRKRGEEFHQDCVNPRKRPGVGMMFWGAFRHGKMGPGLFFQLKAGEKINSTIYRDQVLLGPLKTFYEESKSDIPEPIVMEDGAPVHKGVCKKPREDMKWTQYLHPPNSPDLNPIENIWAWMKHEITTKYMYVTSKAEMQRIAMEMWENFGDDKWNGIIASMPERMKAVIKAKGGHTRY